MITVVIGIFLILIRQHQRSDLSNRNVINIILDVFGKVKGFGKKRHIIYQNDQNINQANKKRKN